MNMANSIKNKIKGPLEKVLSVFWTIAIVVTFVAIAAALVFGAISLYQIISLTWVLFALLAVETIVIIVLAYYVKKFATLIMICEDDYGDVIETLIATEKSIEKILSLQLFFDSIEIKHSVDAIMDDVKANRIDIVRMAERFVERSQQKYETVNMPPPSVEMPMEGPSALDSILDSASSPQANQQINPRGQHIVYRNYRNFTDGDF